MRPKAIKGHVFLDERQERRLRLIRWRRLGLIFSALALAAGIVALYFSPLLRVQTVDVEGAVAVDPAQVRDLAGFGGDSMFRLHTSSAKERIEYLPMVRSVEISRRWPESVVIKITERQPFAYWQAGSTSYVIDNEGVVLANVTPPDGTPVIKALSDPGRLVPGDHVDYDAVKLTQDLLQRVPGQLALNIAALEYSPATGLTLTTDAGYRVVIGDSQNMEYKLAVWQQIEKELGREEMGGHVLDLRFGDRPSFQ